MAKTPDDVKRITSIRDLETDPNNTNKGTPRGRSMVETSVRRNGIGRPVVADKHGRLIAGNTATETIADIFGTDVTVIVVKTDGTTLIVHQRTDLDLEIDPRARELAIADNRASELGLKWDLDILKEIEATGGADLSDYWSGAELDALFTADSDSSSSAPDPTYFLLVTCIDRLDQRTVLARLSSEGLNVRTIEHVN